MFRAVEADEFWLGVQDEFTDATIVHHTSPTAVVVVEQQPEGHRQRTAVADDDDSLSRMASGDRAKGADEPFGEADGEA